MADQESYPVPVWDPTSPVNSNELAGKLNPTYAHNKKQKDELMAIGYVDTYANYPHKEWPRRVYRSNGESLLAESESHEKELVKDGYGRKVFAPKAAASAVPGSAIDGQTKNRVDELEGRIDELTQSISDLQEANTKTAATLDEILAAVTAKKK